MSPTTHFLNKLFSNTRNTKQHTTTTTADIPRTYQTICHKYGTPEIKIQQAVVLLYMYISTVSAGKRTVAEYVPRNPNLGDLFSWVIPETLPVKQPVTPTMPKLVTQQARSNHRNLMKLSMTYTRAQ